MGAEGLQSALIVEDHHDFAEMLSIWLSSTGRFSPAMVHDGHEGAGRILGERPDLVLLDHNLPGLSGLQVLKLVRPLYHGPVLMLTGDKSESLELEALAAGADDFVDKQVPLKLLLARIDAAMRRAAQVARPPAPPALPEVFSAQEPIQVGELEIDPWARKVWVHGREVALTDGELALLWTLGRKAGQTVSRQELHLGLTGQPWDGRSRLVDVYVGRVRRKVCLDSPARQAALSIVTVRGEGYLMG